MELGVGLVGGTEMEPGWFPGAASSAKRTVLTSYKNICGPSVPAAHLHMPTFALVSGEEGCDSGLRNNNTSPGLELGAISGRVLAVTRTRTPAAGALRGVSVCSLPAFVGTSILHQPARAATARLGSGWRSVLG